ncbi:GP25 [Caviid betaherpesvirus 2]|uniref:GP25 n=2 Tax=Caviid betaherpesvirus 2 TaxID=33706 RepID=U6H9S4_9BETA|nr:GP25 [Caviid betaherpesvirus 2]AGE11501.1 GP25 [Caviid betaherpesvirus 2]AIL83889.1 GP25 [BAC cloning vector GPN13BACdenovo_preserved(MM)]BAJ78491.1 GP25 [Caviid betaherpesvirus 2]CDI95367.1 GP25 [Caviid herpesvirus 2 str. CIDMTR]
MGRSESMNREVEHVTRYRSQDEHGASGNVLPVTRKRSTSFSGNRSSSMDQSPTETVYSLLKQGGARPKLKTSSKSVDHGNRSPEDEDDESGIIYSDLKIVATAPKTYREEIYVNSHAVRAWASESRDQMNQLGFNPNIFDSAMVDIIKDCLSPSYLKTLIKFNTTRAAPMSVVVTTLDPMCSVAAARALPIVKPVLKLMLWINCYQNGVAAANNMRSHMRDVMRSSEVNLIRLRMEQAARDGSELIRVLLNNFDTEDLYDGKHLRCLTAAKMHLLSMNTSCLYFSSGKISALRGICPLFRPGDNLCEQAYGIYRKSLENMTLAVKHPIQLICQGKNHPMNEVLSDFLFLAGIRNMLHNYNRALGDLRSFIFYQLEALLETLYLAYVQLPHMKQELLTVVRCVQDVISQHNPSDMALHGLCKSILVFVRDALACEILINPDLTRHALRQLCNGGNTRGGANLTRAICLMNSPLTYRPMVSPDECRNIVKQNVVIPTYTGELTEQTIPLIYTQVENVAPLATSLCKAASAECASEESGYLQEEARDIVRHIQ